jgi:hypothetical protein
MAQAVGLDTITVMAASAAGLTASRSSSATGQQPGSARRMGGHRDPRVQAEQQNHRYAGSTDEVLVLLDGFPVNDPFAGWPTSQFQQRAWAGHARPRRSRSRRIRDLRCHQCETKRHFAPLVSGSVSSYSAAMSPARAVPSGRYLWRTSGSPTDTPTMYRRCEGRRSGPANASCGIGTNGGLSLGPVPRRTASDQGRPGPVTNPTPTAQPLITHPVGIRTTGPSGSRLISVVIQHLWVLHLSQRS